MSGRKRSGRPRKFAEPSRPVTLTLPVRTLEQIRQLGADRARVVERLVDEASSRKASQSGYASVVRMGHHSGLVVVGACRPLASIPGIRLVEIAPGRHLLSVRPGTSPADLELALSDALEDIPTQDASDRDTLTSLSAILKSARRSFRLSREEILILHLP